LVPVPVVTNSWRATHGDARHTHLLMLTSAPITPRCATAAASVTVMREARLPGRRERALPLRDELATLPAMVVVVVPRYRLKMTVGSQW